MGSSRSIAEKETKRPTFDGVGHLVIQGTDVSYSLYSGKQMVRLGAELDSAVCSGPPSSLTVKVVFVTDKYGFTDPSVILLK